MADKIEFDLPAIRALLKERFERGGSCRLSGNTRSIAVVTISPSDLAAIAADDECRRFLGIGEIQDASTNATSKYD